MRPEELGYFPSLEDTEMRDRYFGKYRGLVEDVEDPQARGRVRARVPEVLGDRPSGWALPCVPFAGDGFGFLALPQPGTRVWVEFEAGDPSRPIWSGCWWAEGRAPGTGDEVILSDAHGNCLRMTRGGIEVVAGDGKKILIGAAGIELTSPGDILVKAAGDVTVEAVNVSARAAAQLKAEGSAGAEISSGAQTVVKGAIVKIN